MPTGKIQSNKFIVTFLDEFYGSKIIEGRDEGHVKELIEREMDIFIPDPNEVKSEIANLNKEEIMEYLKERFKDSKIPIQPIDIKDLEIYNYEYPLDDWYESQIYDLMEKEIDFIDWPIDYFREGVLHYLRHIYFEMEYKFKDAGIECNYRGNGILDKAYAIRTIEPIV